MSDIVALFLLLFFVLWIVLTAVVVFYGFFRLIKCVLLVFAAVIVFALLLWGLSALGGEPFQTAVDGILKAIAGNAFAKRTIGVALAVLLNDILDRTLDRKTDERIDDLIEKNQIAVGKAPRFSGKHEAEAGGAQAGAAA